MSFERKVRFHSFPLVCDARVDDTDSDSNERADNASYIDRDLAYSNKEIKESERAFDQRIDRHRRGSDQDV